MTEENKDTLIDAAPASPAKTPRRSTGVGTVLLIPLTLAVAGLGYFLWQQRESVETLQKQVDALAQANAGAGEQTSTLATTQQQLQQSVQVLQSALDQLQGTQQQVLTTQQQQQSNVQQQLQTVSSTVNGQTAQLVNLEREVSALAMRLAEAGEAVIRDQALAEVQGMLRLAEQRLQVAQDVGTAVSLSRTSDELLSKIPEPAIAALRTQLQADMAALQAVTPVDVLAVHQQLGEMITQVDSLTAVSSTAQNTLSVPASEPAAETTEEQSWIDDTVDFLGQYFVITQRDAPITPLLSPEQDWLVRKNVALKLEQARLAVLARDTALFRSMIADARDAIETGLAGESKAPLLSALTDLSGLDLQMTLPSLSSTLAAVEQLRVALPAAAIPAEGQQ